MQPSYAFTDSDTAARRLALLARVFAPTTLEFIRRSVIHPPALIVDLGCGPGYTTHLLADLFPGSRALGLEASARYIALASRTQSERVSFQQHDVTQLPFPVEPADLLYCRFLATHLADPQRAILGWATQLQPYGLLLIEEAEAIHTTNPAFSAYLEIVDTMLRHQSNKLYIGPALAGIPESVLAKAGLRVCSSEVCSFSVSNTDAAGMFVLNLQAWRSNAFVQASYAGEQIDRLEHELLALAHDVTGASEITWKLRQIALVRS